MEMKVLYQRFVGLFRMNNLVFYLFITLLLGITGCVSKIEKNPYLETNEIVPADLQEKEQTGRTLVVEDLYTLEDGTLALTDDTESVDVMINRNQDHPYDDHRKISLKFASLMEEHHVFLFEFNGPYIQYKFTGNNLKEGTYSFIIDDISGMKFSSDGEIDNLLSFIENSNDSYLIAASGQMKIGESGQLVAVNNQSPFGLSKASNTNFLLIAHQSGFETSVSQKILGEDGLALAGGKGRFDPGIFFPQGNIKKFDPNAGIIFPQQMPGRQFQQNVIPQQMPGRQFQQNVIPMQVPKTQGFMGQNPGHLIGGGPKQLQVGNKFNLGNPVMMGNRVGLPLQGIPPTKELLSMEFPGFTPGKQSSGGITGDVFFGSYNGKEVVGKKMDTNEFKILNSLQDTGYAIPIIKNAQSGNAVLMVKAQGDAASVLGGPQLNTQNFKAFAQDSTAGLAVMHKRGIVHQDIKPDNFLQMENGRFVMSDFGGAKTRGMSHNKGHSDPRYIDPSHPGIGSQTADVYSHGLGLGEIYLNLKGKPTKPPELKMLKSGDPIAINQFHTQSKQFQNNVRTQLAELARQGDPVAERLSKMTDLNRANRPTMEEVALFFKSL